MNTGREPHLAFEKSKRFFRPLYDHMQTDLPIQEGGGSRKEEERRRKSVEERSLQYRGMEKRIHR